MLGPGLWPASQRCRFQDRNRPLSWVGWPDMNRRPLRPELAVPLGRLAVVSANSVCWRSCCWRLSGDAAVWRLPHRLIRRAGCSPADHPFSGRAYSQLARIVREFWPFADHQLYSPFVAAVAVMVAVSRCQELSDLAAGARRRLLGGLLTRALLEDP